jgi:hypothetical protein
MKAIEGYVRGEAALVGHCHKQRNSTNVLLLENEWEEQDESKMLFNK